MAIFQKRPWIKYVIFTPFIGVFLCIFTLMALSFWPSYPSKAKLCSDVENFIPKDECMSLEDRFAILDQAFPIGKASSEEIRNTLDEYFQYETSTTYGHYEVYYLSIHPIDYLLQYHDSYHFAFDSNGILVSFSYEDW